jgi:hypothetical protein
MRESEKTSRKKDVIAMFIEHEHCPPQPIYYGCSQHDTPNRDTHLQNDIAHRYDRGKTKCPAVAPHIHIPAVVNGSKTHARGKRQQL